MFKRNIYLIKYSAALVMHVLTNMLTDQDHLLILSAWAKQWLISFNALKTEDVLFTIKHFANLTV